MDTAQPEQSLCLLAAAAAGGDRRAAQELVGVTQTPLWRLCAHMVDRQSAEDLVQETYLRAWPRLASLSGDSNVRAWLAAIAYRVCADELRHRQRYRRRRDRLGSQALAASGPQPAAGDHLCIDDILGKLEPQRRAAFVLTQILGYSYDQAAIACGVPTGTIRSRVARARADLAAEVGKRAVGAD